jgi:hypothetical protein
MIPLMGVLRSRQKSLKTPKVAVSGSRQPQPSTDWPTPFRIMFSEEDFWVGEAITNARLAYECWIGLLKGEITVNQEFAANFPGGSYTNIFANYSKREFLRAVSVLHRGFWGNGMKTPATFRMEELVPVEKIDKFLELARPFRHFRNQEEHRENPEHPPVWTIRINEPRPTIGTTAGNRIDPYSVYELLKSLEPAIGYAAFVISLRDG